MLRGDRWASLVVAAMIATGAIVARGAFAEDSSEHAAPVEALAGQNSEQSQPREPSSTKADASATATTERTGGPLRAVHPIEEIVVTGARQREERLQDVPVAVTAFSGEALDRYGVTQLQEVAQMTPQLLVSLFPTGGGGTLTMRGIGSSSLGAGWDQAVSIYLDGLQYSRADVLNQGYFDLGKIEVLKGPQALFFGKNNSAGAISITSAEPGPEREFIGRGGYEFRADEYWGEAIASGPVTKQLGARIGVRYDHIEGFVDNTAPAALDPGSLQTAPAPANPRWPGKNEFLGKFTLVYRPTDALDVKLKVSGANLDTAGASQGVEMFSCKAFGHATFDSGENCKQDWKIRNNDVPFAVAQPEPTFNRERGALFSVYHAYGIAAPVNYDLGVVKLTSVSGVTHYDSLGLGDFDFTAAPLIWGATDAFTDSYSEELRGLTHFDFPVNFLIGGYFQKSEFENRSVARVLPLPRDPNTGRYITWDILFNTKGTTWSGFGQMIWNVIDTVEFAPGARYTAESKDSFIVNDYIHPVAAPLFKPVGQKVTDKFTDDNISPEITLTWRPKWVERLGSDLTLYGAYKKGFKSGGFSNGIAKSDTTAQTNSFKSEKVSGFEGGMKSTWLDGALLFNTVGYQYDFKDLQVLFFDAATLSSIVQNAASAKTTGLETELRWLPPIDGLNFHGSFSYNIARYDKFLSFCYAGQTLAEGCNLDANGQPQSLRGTRQELGGRIRQLAPRWTGAIGFLYERPLVHGLSLGLGADSNWTDRYGLSPFLRRDVFQDSFFRTDARLSLSAMDGALEIAAVGRNLSNAYFIAADTAEAPLTGQGTGLAVGIPADNVGALNRPREVGIQLTARF